MERIITYIVPVEFDNCKLKSYLKNQLNYSSRLINQLKQSENGMLLNGSKIRTIDKIHSGDVLVLSLPSPSYNRIEPKEMDLNVLYIDDDILIINKTPNIAVHPTHNHQGDTLANGVSYLLENIGLYTPFRVIGRLDKGTSGIIVCALNKYSASVLNGNISKKYCALVSGRLVENGTIDKPIYRPDSQKTIRATSDYGLKAVTHYKIIKYSDKQTFIDINLETGRTHQIRVHFSSENHTLIGDELYGYNGKITHQMLHCYKVEFVHPVKRVPMTFNASLPKDMLKIVNEL